MNVKSIIKKSQYLRNVRQDLNGARRILEHAFKKSCTPKQKLILYPFFAGIHLDLGNIKMSDKLLREGIVFARNMNNDLVLADLLRRYGYFVNKHHKNSYQKALQYVNESIAILERKAFSKGVLSVNDSQKILASAYAAKGNIFADNRKWKEALRWYRKGLRLAEEYFPERAVTIQGDIANIYIWYLNKHFAAKKLLEHVLVFAARFYRHALPAAFQRLGYIYFHEKKYDYADAYFKLAEFAARGLSDKGVWKRELALSIEWQDRVKKQIGKHKENQKLLPQK